jgi:hypothetical protein
VNEGCLLDPAREFLREFSELRNPETGGVTGAHIDDRGRILGGDVSNEGET